MEKVKWRPTLLFPAQKPLDGRRSTQDFHHIDNTGALLDAAQQMPQRHHQLAESQIVRFGEVLQQVDQMLLVELVVGERVGQLEHPFGVYVVVADHRQYPQERQLALDQLVQ